MKKFLITAFALVASVSMAVAGMGIGWGPGGGWMVAFGENPDLENLGAGVAASDSVLWQLIYAGADNVANDIDLSAANYLSGDDELLAERSIAAGGGDAADGTSWNDYLEQQSGNVTYEDLSWSGTGSYVYQRIFQGLPDEGTHYFQTELFAYNSGYAGGGQAVDVFDYDPDGAGVAVNQTIPGGPEPPTPTIPEPATMSLLGLGAMAMVLRRKLRK